MARRIVIMTTGGTIAEKVVRGAGGPRLELAFDGRELAAMACVPDGIELEIDDVFCADSYAVTLDQAVALCRRIEATLARPEVAGAVVTHGTDTLEETAFLADLLVDSDKPVVVTGSMVPASEPGTDVPRNLADAITAAASDEVRGLGTLVAFNNELHAARTLAKTHTATLQLFQSPGWGPLGTVRGGELTLRRRPHAPRRTFRVDRLERRVELVRVALDSSPVPIAALTDAGVAGLVVEALGSGNVPPVLVPAIGRAIAQGVTVVVTSRVGQGPARPVRASPGCGHDLADLGALFAGDLPGHKARLLLMAILSDPATRCDPAGALA